MVTTTINYCCAIVLINIYIRAILIKRIVGGVNDGRTAGIKKLEDTRREGTE